MEQEALRPSPRQEKIFKFLNVAVYGFGLIVAIILLMGLLALLALVLPDEQANSLKGILFYVSLFFIVLLLVLLVPISIATGILFFLNLPHRG